MGNTWLLCLVLAVAASRSATAFPQNDDLSAADGFVFDGPSSGSRDDGSDSAVDRITVPPPRTSTTSTTSRATTTQAAGADVQVDQCVASCPATPEYNPVCGSDSVNYDNPGRLNCAATCGRDVSLRHYGRCMTSKIRG